MTIEEKGRAYEVLRGDDKDGFYIDDRFEIDFYDGVTRIPDLDEAVTDAKVALRTWRDEWAATFPERPTDIGLPATISRGAERRAVGDALHPHARSASARRGR
jgi:hypothetical protein